VKILQADGKSKGSGFVQFKSSREANEVIKDGDNLEIDGRYLKLYLFQLEKLQSVGQIKKEAAATHSNQPEIAQDQEMILTRKSIIHVGMSHILILEMLASQFSSVI
jgi:hypothetical protein